MIKINDVKIPTPSTYAVGIQDLSKAERNARGGMIKEYIATKRKLEMTWKHIANEKLKELFELVQSNFFSVEYPDPQTGDMRTGTFYAGDRKVGAMDYQDGNIRWTDVQFNVIER